MCLLPLHNSPGCAKSGVALPHHLAALKSLPLATGLGLSLTIGLLYPGRTLAQTLSSQEPAQLSNAEASTAAAAAQHLLFVSPIVGNDASADGSQRSPFRTITAALQTAQANTVIMLSPGTYSVETGEVFPLMLKPGVTVQGDPSTQGRGIVIRGGGAFLSPTSAGQNIAILGANQAQVVGVTVTNPNPRGYGIWVESSSPIISSNTFTGNTHDGLSTVGNSAPLIRRNQFNHNGANGITVFGQSQPEIRDNVFEQTGFAINVAENAQPLIVNNRMNQNKVAVLVQENARPVLRGNTIESSQQDGVTAIAHAQPNLGTANDPGNNIFRNNPVDLNADASDQTISAFGNQLTSDRIEGKVDLAGTVNPAVAQANTAQSIPSTVGPQVTPPITSLPPSTISTLPPNQNAVQTAPTTQVLSAARSPAHSSPAASATHSSVETAVPAPSARSTNVATIHALPPAASRPAIVPIAQPRSAQSAHQPAQPTVEISVPPPELRPAVASRSQAAPTPQVSPISNPSSSNTFSSNTSSSNLSTVALRRTAVAPTTSAVSPLPAPAPSPAVSATPARAIEIPVPAPRTTLAYAARPAAAFNAPINIPVPPPESVAVAPAAVSRQTVPTPPQTGSAAPSANLLPVPSGDVPVGNVGDLPRVNVASTQMGSMYFASQIQSSLRYRVVVDASSEVTQSLVQSIVPNAFLTSINGQRLMQVGAFNSRDNAEQTVQMLNQNGLVAVIQEIE